MIHSRIHNNKIQLVFEKSSKKSISILKDIIEELSVLRPGYQFELRYKSGRDDGKDKFFLLKHLSTNQILLEIEIGFKKRLEKFGIYLTETPHFNKKEILDFLKKEISNLPFKPRKYQIKMIIGMIQHSRHLGVLSTGGGKSLVSYLVIKFLLEKNKKTILIVPTIGLVDQMYSDFLSYNASKEFIEKIQKIGGDYTDKTLHKPIIISTWQSLNNVKRKEIETFYCLYVDESHKAKADVLNDILKTSVKKKLGQTGSLPIIEIDSMKLEEIFGIPVTYANAKDLIDLGLLTKTIIIAVFINYPKKLTLSSWKYQEEVKFIRENKLRITYNCNLLKTIQKSGIVVATFSTIKYGETMYEKLAGKKIGRDKNNFERQKDRGVFYISGSTKPKVREQIRNYLNSSKSTNEILIAQTTTIDTGINIPKMRNFVFLEAPGKSFIKILQSIGRVMRKSKASKNSVYVWDLVDCFVYIDENYTLKHFWEREQYYRNEGHPVIEKEIILNEVDGLDGLNEW